MATVLLTGYPGFIGTRLARQLLADDAELRIVALVEERMRETAERAATEHGGRIEIVSGDIGDRRLGLDDETYERLAAEVARVYHLAAIYDLAVPVEIAQRVNVEGTANVLELCLVAERLERLAYVSTAYVAGLRTGVVYEHELSMGQEFKNHYESTKFQAEVWVREHIDRIPTTIMRPAIVVGDSSTGETQKFDGPYYLLRAISRAASMGRAIPQFARKESPFNVVPIDFVVAAIAATAGDPAAEGRTLHLVDPDPLSSRELVAALSEEYAGRAPRGRLPAPLVEASLRLKPVQNALGGTPRESIVYLSHSVRFDTRNAVDLLTPHGLRPPGFRDYVGPMVEFFRSHEDDPAFGSG
jgi:thioester reductase-like protein